MARGIIARWGERGESGPVAGIVARFRKIRRKLITPHYQRGPVAPDRMVRHQGRRGLSQRTGPNFQPQRVDPSVIPETHIRHHLAPTQRRATVGRPVCCVEPSKIRNRGREPQYVTIVENGRHVTDVVSPLSHWERGSRATPPGALGPIFEQDTLGS